MSNAAGEETDKRAHRHEHVRAQAYISQYIDTGRTHTRACIRTYRWRGEREEGRESARGHSRRGIHRIRDISRQNQLLIWFPGVGWWYRGRSTSEEPRRAGEVEGRAGEKERDGQREERQSERVRGEKGSFNQDQKASGATDYCLRPIHPSPPSLSLPYSPALFSSSLLCIPVSSGRPWLAHEVNNHQKSQCLSRAAALCAPTRAPDANMTPPGLYYELLELLHRRRIFTCSARELTFAGFFCASLAFFPLRVEILLLVFTRLFLPFFWTEAARIRVALVHVSECSRTSGKQSD